MTSKQYEELLKHAKGMCYSKYNIKKAIDPDELIMQVYSDSQDIIDKPEFISIMRRKMRHFVNFKGYDRFSFIDSVKHAKCLKCKGVKSISEYNLYENKYTKEIDCVPGWCKKCMNDYHKKYYKTAQGKKLRNQNFKNYVERNRESWNNYVKKRYEFDKENLTDRYVRKVLKAKYKGVEVTDDMMEKERERLKQKRTKLT